jgi:hypothetical protein
MKRVSYRILTIFPNKLGVEIRVTVDPNRRYGNGEFISTGADGAVYTTLSVSPLIVISILRPGEVTDTGLRVRAPYNNNDHLRLNTAQTPIFAAELNNIMDAIKIPEMFSYAGKRLIVNEELAQAKRRTFTIGGGNLGTVVDMVPVVILQPDETRVEGIQLKFNDDSSSVLLTLNDMESLYHCVKNTQFDHIALDMYVHFCRTGQQPAEQKVTTPGSSGPRLPMIDRPEIPLPKFTVNEPPSFEPSAQSPEEPVATEETKQETGGDEI